jgi:PIN domain nuclease of toxin-antitoxin system
MLVAQAQLESLALMSADRAFGTYTVELIDATA